MAIARLLAWRSIHSIDTEPAPAPTSHNNSPCTRRQGGQCHGSDIGLRQLAVILEPTIVETGRERDDTRIARRDDVDRHDIERIDVLKIEGVGGRVLDRLAWAAHRFEDRDVGIAKAAFAQQTGDPPGRRAVP